MGMSTLHFSAVARRDAIWYAATDTFTWLLEVDPSRRVEPSLQHTGRKLHSGETMDPEQAWAIEFARTRASLREHAAATLQRSFSDDVKVL